MFARESWLGRGISALLGMLVGGVIAYAALVPQSAASERRGQTSNSNPAWSVENATEPGTADAQRAERRSFPATTPATTDVADAGLPGSPPPSQLAAEGGLRNVLQRIRAETLAPSLLGAPAAAIVESNSLTRTSRVLPVTPAPILGSTP